MDTAAGPGPRDGPDRAPQGPGASPEEAAADGVKTDIAGGAEALAAAGAADEADPGGGAAAAGPGGDAEASASEPMAEANEGGGGAAAAAGGDRPAAPEADADGGAGKGRSAVHAVSEVEQGQGIAGAVQDVDPAVSEVKKMDVSEGGDASKQKQHSPSCTASEVDVGIVPVAVRDLDPVGSEVGMEVDDGHVREQERARVAVAGSEFKMEEADGRVVHQGSAATSAGGLQARAEEVGECLVGRYIGRNAPMQAGILIGKVASYDSTAGIYSVVFEDGHNEDLELPELHEFLMPDKNGTLGMSVNCRKRKLGLLVLSGSVSEVKEPASTRQRVDGCEIPANTDALRYSGSGSDMSEDIESSSNSSDFTKEEPSEPCPPVQAVELPPSSGDIPVPEDSISYLFSVYNFLRSFSVQLFLSPFGLDDFVAAINCTVQNNLLDAVHVSLLRALRRYLESKSAQGSQMASNCLKYIYSINPPFNCNYYFLGAVFIFLLQILKNIHFP